LTPSRRELAQATGMPVINSREVVAASHSLIERCGFGAVLVSLGRDGMILIEPNASVEIDHGATGDVFDPNGAEDTAVAALAAGLGAGLDLEAAARLASLAVAIVSGKAGTAVVSAEELAAGFGGPRSEPVEPVETGVDMAPQPRRRRQGEA
jgi:D-beta-D-heptose 7-phosphate kinase/D-beta-D-heptose 1-phosphate adenosyltransferase